MNSQPTRSREVHFNGLGVPGIGIGVEQSCVGNSTSFFPSIMFQIPRGVLILPVQLRAELLMGLALSTVECARTKLARVAAIWTVLALRLVQVYADLVGT